VGDRQKGRLAASSVIASGQKKIDYGAIQEALTKDVRMSSNPYGMDRAREDYAF